jgi:hypothetical protein
LLSVIVNGIAFSTTADGGDLQIIKFEFKNSVSAATVPKAQNVFSP